MNSNKFFGSARIVLLALIMAGCQKNSSPEGGSSSKTESSALVSAEKTSFDEVTAKLDKGGSLYLYLSTEKALDGLSVRMAGLTNLIANWPNLTTENKGKSERVLDFATAWLKDSGVEEISGVGMSSVARATNFYFNKVIIHHYPGKNQGVIWSLLGDAAHPLAELDMLPEDTALALFSDLNVPLLWSDIQKRVNQLNIPGADEKLKEWPDQFRKMTGLEFDQTLASLGGNYGLILTLNPNKKISVPYHGGTVEAPEPALALVARVKSDLLFDRIDALGKNNPLVVRVETNDLKMRTMTIPLPLPVELRPTVARSGEYMILASTDAIVEEIVAVKAGQKKSFKTTAEFARLSQGVPLVGNSFTLVSDNFVKTMMEFQKNMLPQGSNGLSADQFDSLQHMFNSATNYGTFSVGAYGPEGWEGVANGSQSIQSALVPMAIGVCVAAGAIIPAYLKANALKEPTAAIHAFPTVTLPAKSVAWAGHEKAESFQPRP